MNSIKLKINNHECKALLEMLKVVSLDITMHPFEQMAIAELIMKVNIRLQSIHLRLNFSRPGTMSSFSFSWSEAWATHKALNSVISLFGGFEEVLFYRFTNAFTQQQINITHYAKTKRLDSFAR